MTKILVVEDEASFSEALSYVLGKEGFEVTVADTGDGAIAAFDKSGADLVLLDLMLPGLSGTEVCKQLRARSDVPIIMLTAKDTEVDKVVGLELGADDYVTKPFDSDILLARVDSVLRNRGQLRKYFLDSITLRENINKVSVEYKEFLDKCIEIVEANLENSEFNLKTFSAAMGMSHSSLYKKIKAISGQTVNGFIRSIRIRRAAVIMLTESINIAQVGPQVGIEDQRYFRQQFVKLFGMKPSEYIKKYRNSFNKELNIIQKEDL